MLVCDYCKGLVNTHTEPIIVKILNDAKVSVVDSKRKDFSLWRHATAIVPNRKEAMSIYGSSDPCEIQRMVGCEAVYITRGAESVLMGCENGEVEIAVGDVAENPYVVGAGDCFAAGIVLGLGKGLSHLEAGMLGAKMAHGYVAKARKSPMR